MNRLLWSSIPFLGKQVPFHPLIYFLLFLTANSLLSYGSLPLTEKLWIGLLGVGLPFFSGIHAIWIERHRKMNKNPIFDDSFVIPIWLWTLFFVLLLFTRFYRLTTLPIWPLGDEGICGILGLHQSQQWQWRILWQDGVEPLLIWSLGVYFKFIEPSLFSFRLFPTLVSILTCLAAYWAAKQYFSRLISFGICWFFAFSFWEFTLSRNCLLPIPVPLLQCLTLGWLGKFLKSSSGTKEKKKNLLILGVFAGLGFYTWMNWMGVWLSVAFILMTHAWLEKKNRNFWEGGIFFVLTFVLILPLLLARLAPGGTHMYIQHLSFVFFPTFLLYWEGIFWHGASSYPYGPNWGGFLNPILGSLVLTGFLNLIRTRDHFFIGAMTTCLFLSSLPGLLSNGLELYRVLPLFPFLMVIAVWGVQSLFQGNLRPWSLGLVFTIILGSCFLDVYNYTFHYTNVEESTPDRQWRAVECQHLYGILKNLERKAGPLFVFSEFSTDYDDKTLNLAVYPFDALQNLRLTQSHPQWAALIVNIRYAPYFQRTFPSLKYEAYEPNYKSHGNHTTLGLFLIPTSEIPSVTLSDWIEADRFYRNINLDIKNKNPIDRWGDIPRQFYFLESRFPNDPFLTSIYWEKVAFFKIIERDYENAAVAYENAVKRGYPAAHLYFEWGLTLRALGRENEAQKVFRKFEELSKSAL